MENKKLVEWKRKIEERHSIVHCITNVITIWDCANLLLAAGASPTMAHYEEETAEITAGCDALVCNLGEMNDFGAMLQAAPVATRLGHPIVVDPVGCSGSSFRRKRFWELAGACKITCIRGNAAEITALADSMDSGAGVDAREITRPQELKDLMEKATKLAKQLDCIVIASGITDVITDGNRVETLSCGDVLLSKITGSGCMLSCLLGASLAVESSMEGAIAACLMMGTCGERAAQKTREQQGGSMTFHTHLIDEMYLL